MKLTRLDPNLELQIQLSYFRNRRTDEPEMLQPSDHVVFVHSL